MGSSDADAGRMALESRLQLELPNNFVFKHLPIWIFHGDKDTVVAYQWSRIAFEKLKTDGGNCKLTGVGMMQENSQTATLAMCAGFVTEYSNERCDRQNNVWQWLFS